MKSVKLYFSLLLSAVMLATAAPVMAQDVEATAEQPATEQTEAEAVVTEAELTAPVVEVAEAEEVAAHGVAKSTQGRENTDIDAEFSVGKAIGDFVNQSGFKGFAKDWRFAVMILISFVLLYLAIVKKFEPLLLMPIAFGMLLTNLPGADMFHSEFFAGGHVHWDNFALGSAGLLDYLYLGVKLGIYPCLIFIGVGAMTDFGPLIANPKSLLLGAAAQIGIFATFLGALALGFNYWESGSIGIIGGADGPTAIYLTSKLAPHLLGPIAVAAYSYMALVPVIQPPIMKLLTTEKERKIEMKQLRSVSQREKIIFPIVITVIIAILLPSAAPLIGCLMLGNLMKECGVTERLSKTVQNELMNIVTIFLGISVGATTTADAFLNWQTLGILLLGVIAFSFGSASGVILAKVMNLFSKEKINPLIGSAGVSAVPMAARVSQTVGQQYNPGNFLLMHAMGPNVAGVIGSAVAAGILLAFLPL
ncbi:MAG: sodium ion-translocating decarboxylase subunit beta [Alistipes sp.]|nr:sodium ion-translocating decarboxylase subunit beta [Alistipes sp.]